jgi:hypothetical protein
MEEVDIFGILRWFGGLVGKSGWFVVVKDECWCCLCLEERRKMGEF